MAPKIDVAQRRKIADLLKAVKEDGSKYTSREIAETLGCSLSTIGIVRKAQIGVPLNERVRLPLVDVVEDEIENPEPSLNPTFSDYEDEARKVKRDYPEVPESEEFQQIRQAYERNYEHYPEVPESESNPVFRVRMSTEEEDREQIAEDDAEKLNQLSKLLQKTTIDEDEVLKYIKAQENSTSRPTISWIKKGGHDRQVQDIVYLINKMRSEGYV
jgi:uncharacterized protein YdiU (UPF0061 family)